MTFFDFGLVDARGQFRICAYALLSPGFSLFNYKYKGGS